MKRLFLIVTFLLTNQIFAHENPDQKSLCYIFKNNKLQSKSACIMSSGGGAGGMYTILKVGKKSYHFETNTMHEDWETVYYTTKNLSKSVPVTEYIRDSKTFKILKDNEIQDDDKLLYCNKTKDGKLDICYD